LPWIDKVSIRRKWPNILIVNIEEQHPIARWKNEALFNASGMLFTPPATTFPAGLPLLLGPEEEVQDVIANYQTIQKLLIPLNFKITQLDVDERGFWHMIVNGNLNVFFGNEDVLSRLKNFITAYPKIITDHPDKKIAAIDLRYKNGVAVHWEGQ
jgi:cell division protein FtsQ